MAKSPYTGFTTLYSERYKNLRIGQVTNKHGDTHCTKCKRTDKIEFDGEHIQTGAFYNKYFEFNHCENCGYRFCVVMLRKDDNYDDR